jgi:hypothetical protein
MGECDLRDYWTKELQSGDNNNMDENDDVMESVKRRALEQTITHKQSHKPKSKKRSAISGSERADTIKLSGLKDQPLSEMDDDPLMSKYWANQEATPGF